jgi:hypothetical protein
MPPDVKIASFGTVHEAELAWLYLDGNGFDCRLEDDMVISTALYFESALGGVKLFVPQDQAEEASLSLEEFRTEHARERRPESRRKRVSRAFRIAILGLFLCPGPMHLWSYLLVVKTDPNRLSPASRRTRRITIALDLIGMLLAAVIALSVFVEGFGEPIPSDEATSWFVDPTRASRTVVGRGGPPKGIAVPATKCGPSQCDSVASCASRRSHLG